jgi:hypothetical protein
MSFPFARAAGAGDKETFFLASGGKIKISLQNRFDYYQLFPTLLDYPRLILNNLY